MGKASGASGNDRALVNQWLEDLGRLSRVDLHLDADGVCTIGHESGLDCAVEVPGNGSVYLRVALLPWEPEDNPDMAERCLLGSFMGISTGGAAFGVDPMDAELILWQERPLVCLDEVSFANMVAQILDNSVRWRRDLEAAEEEATRDDTHERRPPLDFSMRRV